MDSFLVPGAGPYLLTHSVGCLPKLAHDALMSGFVRPWAERGGNAWPEWLRQIDDFRAQLAALLGGSTAEYCAQSNLSSGLVKVLGALPPGQRVVLAAEDTFPSLGFVLRQAERLGFTTRFLPRESPPDDLRSWVQALTADVRMVLVTHVHSNTGRVAPVAEIARLCRERDIVCVVDVAQSAGILPVDFPALGVDVALGSCIKWLCGGPGAGFLWMRGELVAQLAPMDVGWFSHADPFEMDIRSFRYADDARRFWGGTPSVAPFVTAAASLSLIRERGVDQIRAYNRELGEIFARSLPAAWRTRLPAYPHGGTLCIPLGAEFDAVTAALRAAGVQFDHRGDVVRLSFHACNSRADAECVARAFDESR